MAEIKIPEGKQVAEFILDGFITAAAVGIASSIFLSDAPLSDQGFPLVIVFGIGAGAWKLARQWKAFQ